VLKLLILTGKSSITNNYKSLPRKNIYIYFFVLQVFYKFYTLLLLYFLFVTENKIVNCFLYWIVMNAIIFILKKIKIFYLDVIICFLSR
jgi:hypothetical protein